jgi:regulator of protease activity HflC (stomatin/prohibitin superfamily)
MYILLFLVGMLLFVLIQIRLYTVRPDECAVITSFGRAQRLAALKEGDTTLSQEEQERYQYPQLLTRGPGGPYIKLPWQRVHKVRVATESVDICWDPSKTQTSIESVTKDNLTTGVRGQIRYTVSKGNLYPYLFGVDSPLEHVMGFLISVLRERIANFTDPNHEHKLPVKEGDLEGTEVFEGVSINDIRKNLPLLNRYMEEQCASTAGRYGVELDAALITEIDPPPAVDHALSAINSTRNQVAGDISTARADAEQQITMSKRAVEIAFNNAEAEVAPLREIAVKLADIKKEGGSESLAAYLRNFKIPLLRRTTRIIDSL